MSWQMRHEGSPHATSGLSPNQVLEGVKEGVWGVSDEVRGPTDARWTPLESHPYFEEAIAELDEPIQHHDVEEHLDMNPLIDVALVLLIFFILTTSYEALRRVMDMPNVSQKKDGAIKKVDADDVKAHFVVVKATMVDGKPQFMVDERVVEEQFLQTAIEVGVSQGRNQLIIDVDSVTWDTVVKIIDAGQGAKVAGFKMRVK
jgi:biopolymer transport protein ExbD